ncbi:MAG: response regulator [Deltaproteobacteria bacterium]|nr:response regulator [Deltaproteobacteria bacterium]
MSKEIPNQAPKPGNLKILMLEDYPPDAELVKFELRQAGLEFTADLVETEAEFLKALDSLQPDLILADYKLPHYNGLKALAQVREKQPEIPFIFVSGTMGEEVAIDSLQRGATDYVLKSRLSRLAPAVQRALREAQERLERQQAEAALGKRERDYRLLVKTLPAVVYKGYLDWSVDFVDDKILELTGYQIADFDTRRINWRDLILPEDLAAAKREFVKCMAAGGSFVREYRIRDRQGRVRWIQDRGQIISSPEGQVDHITGVLFDIHEHKMADERAAWQRTILDAINRIFREALVCRTEEELGRTCLTALEELTESKFGLIAELNRTGGLDLLAMTDPGWKLCRLPPGSLPKNLEVGGLVKKVVRERESVLTNAPGSHPDRCGVPEGHPPLTAFLGVPLVHGERALGLIGLANKEGGYTPRDRETAEALAIPFVEALMRHRAEGEVRQSEQKLRVLTSQLLTAQEQERKRISMELHDELGQSLNALKLQMRAIERALGQDQQQQKHECAQLLSYLDEVIDNVRRLSRDLSPAILEDLGLEAALKYLFDGFNQYYDVKYSLELEDLNNLFPPEAQITIYRIFQEVLTNISKHAHATQVKISIGQENDNVTLRVKDNGAGFDVGQALARKAPERGLGLAALDERARMLGGSLQVWSETGKGARITVVIPVSGVTKEWPGC